MEKSDGIGKSYSLDELVWQHITHVLEAHDGNISAAGRALGMHRRTLQRKLQRREEAIASAKATP